MRFWLLLTSFLVQAHRESQNFAVQLDEEIEEPAPTILASPENWSSVLGSIELEPLRVHLLPGVYSNVSFVLPPGATLELQGEPGTKIGELVVSTAKTTPPGARPNAAELILKTLLLTSAVCEDALALSSLALVDVAVKLLRHRLEATAALSITKSRLEETYLLSSRCSSAGLLTIQRSVLMHIHGCATEAKVIDSTIRSAEDSERSTLRTDSAFISGSKFVAFDSGSLVRDVRKLGVLVSSTLESTRVHTGCNFSISNSTISGAYHFSLNAAGAGRCHKRVETSYFGRCPGSCIVGSMYNASVSVLNSSMQTGMEFRGAGLHMEMRDLDVFHVHSTFLACCGGWDTLGLKTLDASISFLRFRNVWNPVSIHANNWTLAMRNVTMEQVTLAGLVVEAEDEMGRGVAQLHDVSMSNILGVGLVLDQTLANIRGMTCRACNVAIEARDSSLSMTGVDILGRHKQSNGIVLKSSLLEASDVCMTNLAAGLLLNSSTVHPEDTFITDNALGVLPVNTTGTINGFIYFNDAADELCSGHPLVCPKVGHEATAMQLHYAKALLLSLFGCIFCHHLRRPGSQALLYQEEGTIQADVLLDARMQPVARGDARRRRRPIGHPARGA
ncbi:unnamed protein product [Symbiodinium sp. CCMP2456]|nr:unnamed protein product [Symbiodinium sp. CCMP2456]